MEAIDTFRSSFVDSQYETLLPIAESDMHSYTSMTHHHGEVQHSYGPSMKVLYDEPTTSTQTQIPRQKDDSTPLAGVEYEEPIVKTNNAPSKLSTKAPLFLPTPKTTTLNELVPSNASKGPGTTKSQTSVGEDINAYDTVDATVSTGLHEPMHSKIPRSPHRSTTVPRELSSMSEIPLEELSKLNPNDAQLLMLLQMQKMVQVYGTTTLGKPSIEKLKSEPNLPIHHRVSKSPPPPLYKHSLHEVEEEYDPIHQQPVSQHPFDGDSLPVPPQRTYSSRNQASPRERSKKDGTNREIQLANPNLAVSRRSPYHHPTPHMRPPLPPTKPKPDVSGKYHLQCMAIHPQYTCLHRI